MFAKRFNASLLCIIVGAFIMSCGSGEEFSNDPNIQNFEEWGEFDKYEIPDESTTGNSDVVINWPKPNIPPNKEDNTDIPNNEITPPNPDVPDDGKDKEEDKDPESLCYMADDDICQIEQLIIKKTNELRKSNGLSALENNKSLSYVSRDWSRQQASRGGISHTGFPSSRNTVLNTLKGIVADSLLIKSLTGENVAAHSSSSSSIESCAEKFYTMWKNSAGHRRNMLGSHKYIGVGVYKASKSTYSVYATQIFAK